MAAVQCVSGGAETHFAKKLASNEKPVRDKAIKKLRMWLSSRRDVSSGLSETDLLKLWKGLFYCMWMSDKPKIQEELAETIAQLLNNFGCTNSAFEFLAGFFKTMHKEWHGIDRLRLDKFYLLIRKFIYQSILFLKKHDWDVGVVLQLNQVLGNGPLNPISDPIEFANGVQVHVILVFIDELFKIDHSKLTSSTFLKILEPFSHLLATSKSRVITRNISQSVFKALLDKNKMNEGDSCSKVDFDGLAEQFFTFASRKEIQGRNRNILYDYITKFKKANCSQEENVTNEKKEEHLNGVQPPSTNGEIVEENNSEACDVVDIVDNEISTEKKNIKKKRKRKSVSEKMQDNVTEMAKENNSEACNVVEIAHKVSTEKSKIKEKRKRKSEGLTTIDEETNLSEMVKENNSVACEVIDNEVSTEKNKIKKKRKLKSVSEKMTIDEQTNLTEIAKENQSITEAFIDDIIDKVSTEKKKVKKKRKSVSEKMTIDEKTNLTEMVKENNPEACDVVEIADKVSTEKNKMKEKKKRKSAGLTIGGQDNSIVAVLDSGGKSGKRKRRRSQRIQNKEELKISEPSNEGSEKKKRNETIIIGKKDDDTVENINQGEVEHIIQEEMSNGSKKDDNIAMVTRQEMVNLDGSYLGTIPNEKVSESETLLPRTENETVLNVSATFMEEIGNSLKKYQLNLNQEPEEVEASTLPLAFFIQHSMRKANTDPRKKKERKDSITKQLSNSAEGNNRKQVRIELSKNTSQTTRDYHQCLRSSPVVPFDATKKPVHSSLKTQSLRKSRKRPTAGDFF